FRGQGNFHLSLKTMEQLHRLGFKVSIARLSGAREDVEAVNRAYAPFFKKAGLPEDTHIVVFSEFLEPGSNPEVPYITENCMTTYKTEEMRAGGMMCSFSKMVVKKDGRMRVYACTLVDDDEDYDLGGSLSEAMKIRVMLKHHRCYTCFANGASCSEI
ncbi:MAG: radical SAM protein, partial [Verrucomicrobia bacterium]